MESSTRVAEMIEKRSRVKAAAEASTGYTYRTGEESDAERVADAKWEKYVQAEEKAKQAWVDEFKDDEEKDHYQYKKNTPEERAKMKDAAFGQPRVGNDHKIYTWRQYRYL